MAERLRARKPDDALSQRDYSAMGLLPGENPLEFEELHKDLIVEFAPDGPLEADHVSTLARLLWRKRKLSTFREAERAIARRWQMICEEKARRNLPELTGVPILPNWEMPDGTKQAEAAYRKLAEAHGRAERAADEEARKELGDLFEFTEQRDLGTTERLMAELEIEERLDAAIDQCLKRLRALRKLKRNRY